MLDYLGSDLDQLLTQRSQRPCLHRLGQFLEAAGTAQVSEEVVLANAA